MKTNILFLQQEDVIAAGILNMSKVLELVEKAYNLEGQGEIMNPAKTELGIPFKGGPHSDFIAMPVYIGGDVNRPGVKWAAESSLNAKKGNLPMGIDLVILSDPETVLPVAIMDGLVITAMRTSATAGVVAKYLAPKGAKVAGCVGAGIIGRTMIMALKEALPELELIKLYDIKQEKAQNLSKEFKGEIEVVPVTSVEEAVTGSDVVATMTTSKDPFVKGEWIKSGAMVIQISSNELETSVVKKANKVVVDNWEQMKGKDFSVLATMVKDGILEEDRIWALNEVVCGKKPGRENDDEITLFSSRGMGCLDILVGDYLYKEALKKDIGQKLVLWDEAKWL